jgi:phosphotransferase system enzyme I (PtsP)
MPHRKPPPAPPSTAIAERPASFEPALDFVAFASKAMPLTALLDGLPARIARLLRADVVSVYLCEGTASESGRGEGLVLRGNVGFTPRAQGTIRLRVGEGLTGLAVAEQRPVAVVRAPGHGQFRRFDSLDEDRFPVFLAVPIPGPDRKGLGALVAQRQHGPFTSEEITLATTLAAPIAHAVRQAGIVHAGEGEAEGDRPMRRTGGGTGKITLPGKPIVGGRALGAIAALRRPAKDRKTPPRPDEEKHIASAFDAAARAVRTLQRRAEQLHLVGETSFLANYALMASDGRLRERALELVREGQGAAEALSTVAREVARAATGVVGHPFLAERSRDIEDLCDAVLMLAAPDARAQAPSKAVILADEITVFDLLVTARREPSGIALTKPETPRTEVLLKLLGAPAIAEVEGALRWASPGDVALLDADHGFFIVNPSRAEVAALRAWRKRTAAPQRAFEDEPTVA